jgi:hypothetical protein
VAQNTIKGLIEGNIHIVRYYQKAFDIWTEILSDPEANDVGRLADLLVIRQSRFEKECGGRFLGREIMAAVGIGQFYISPIEGFGNNMETVTLIRQAFAQSRCHIEVKVFVGIISKVYDLQ